MKLLKSVKKITLAFTEIPQEQRNKNWHNSLIFHATVMSKIRSASETTRQICTN